MSNSPKQDNLSGPTGVDGFIADTSRLAGAFPASPAGCRRFVLRFAERNANIRLADIWHPLRFLRQMEGAPPASWGVDGFRLALVDDPNPARHYTAFFFVGYWLPWLLSVVVLWLWELAGFVRYGFNWSLPDVRCGLVGVWHGRLVRRHGHWVLPSLLARDLWESGRGWSRLSESGRRAMRARRRPVLGRPGAES